MAFRIFTIPACNPDESLRELNEFLASHRVLEITKHFHGDASGGTWHFCASYTAQGRKAREEAAPQAPFGGVDYMKKLTEDQFVVFARLRDVRKDIAAEKAVKLFTIFTNRELAEMAKRRVKTIGDLRAIEGIGEKKAAAYGERFLAAIAELECEGLVAEPERETAAVGETPGKELF